MHRLLIGLFDGKCFVSAESAEIVTSEKFHQNELLPRFWPNCPIAVVKLDSYSTRENPAIRRLQAYSGGFLLWNKQSTLTTTIGLNRGSIIFLRKIWRTLKMADLINHSRNKWRVSPAKHWDCGILVSFHATGILHLSLHRGQHRRSSFYVCFFFEKYNHFFWLENFTQGRVFSLGVFCVFDFESGIRFFDWLELFQCSQI